jgi:hypothetical protein
MAIAPAQRRDCSCGAASPLNFVNEASHRNRLAFAFAPVDEQKAHSYRSPGGHLHLRERDGEDADEGLQSTVATKEVIKCLMQIIVE